MIANDTMLSCLAGDAKYARDMTSQALAAHLGFPNQGHHQELQYPEHLRAFSMYDGLAVGTAGWWISASPGLLHMAWLDQV